MYILKGFAQINPLINNALATIAPIGELSPAGWSFAREKTTHTSADHPGIELITFTSSLDGVGVAPESAYTSMVLEVMHWVYMESVAGQFSANSDNFQSQFITQFGVTLDLLDSGVMTQGSALWCPTFVDFTFTGEGEEPNRCKVWFVGEAFFNEFDDFEILTVDPIVNLDDFFLSYNQVKLLVNDVTVPALMDKIHAVKDGYPETTIVSNTFDWIDPVNRTLIVPVDWTTVIYGAAGQNLDDIKGELISHILENSTHPREEWEIIFPDLFMATEFILTPLWNHYSIPNRTLEAGLYSPVVPIQDALALANVTCKGTGYTVEHIADVAQIVPNTYKSLSMVAVGGPKNRNDINQFNRQFRDYLAVPTTHLDFMRMAPATRNFIMILNGMLRHAEELTPISSIPRDHTRTVREGILYLSRTIDKVQYLIVTKYSFNEEGGILPAVLVDGDGYTLTDGEEPLV